MAYQAHYQETEATYGQICRDCQIAGEGDKSEDFRR